jgi:hypothetical protein
MVQRVILNNFVKENSKKSKLRKLRPTFDIVKKPLMSETSWR